MKLNFFPLVLAALFALTSSWTIAGEVKKEAQCEALISGEMPKIVITEKAISHILVGEFGTNPRTKKRILKGGMHTFEALEAFLGQRPDLFELGRKLLTTTGDAPNFDHWVFITTSPQSGASHVRLPKSAFHKKALKGLLGADIHLKGSYLWKTLFPEGTDEQQLKKWILEVYTNPDSIETRQNHFLITGSVSQPERQSPLSIRLLVEKSTGHLISAYPDFFQPGSFLRATPSDKTLFVDKWTPTPRAEHIDADREAFAKSMNTLLNWNFHRSSKFFPKNFFFWKKMKVSEKIGYLFSFFVEREPFFGSLLFTESLAIDSQLPGYQAFDFTFKALDAIEVFAEDSSIPVRVRKAALLDFLINQPLIQGYLSESVILSKIIFARLLRLADQLDLGEKVELIKVLERSPSLPLLMFPSQKSQIEPQKTILSIARLVNKGAYGTTLTGTDITPQFLSWNRRLFERYQKFSGAEWRYFQLVLEAQELESESVDKMLPRKMLFADFLNTLVSSISWAKNAQFGQLPDKTFLGHKIKSTDFFSRKMIAETIAVIRRHRGLIEELLFNNKETFQRWMKEVESLAKISHEELATGLKNRGDSVADREKSEYRNEAKSIKVHFPHIKVIAVNGEIRVDFRWIHFDVSSIRDDKLPIE